MAANDVAALARDIQVHLEFVNAREEELLLHRIENVPKTRWTLLSGRRLQSYGGTPTDKGMIAQPLPSFLAPLCARLHIGSPTADPLAMFATAPNHCLVNAYRPGEGIAAHEDGPLYEPRVAILSLGAPIVMNFYTRGEVRCWRAGVFLPRRSLLVFAGEAYDNALHCIESTEADLVSPRTVINWAQAVEAMRGVHRPSADAHGDEPADGAARSVTHESHSVSATETSNPESPTELRAACADAADARPAAAADLETARERTGDEDGFVLPRETRHSITVRVVKRVSALKLRL